jgi:hypothetical protein
MNLKIKNKKGEFEDVEVKFTSFWGSWVLAYFATVGVIIGVCLAFGMMIGILELIFGGL